MSIICVFLLLFATYSQGAVITFNTVPAKVFPGFTENVTLRCSISDSPAPSGTVIGRREVSTNSENVEQVSSIIITQNNRDVASVAVSHNAKTLTSASNVQVFGDVSKKTGERGYLELQFQYPTWSQLGEFQCEMTAVKENGHGAIYNVNTNTHSGQTTIVDIAKKVKNATEEHITHMLQNYKNNINSLESKNTAQQTQIASLQNSKLSLQNSLSIVQNETTAQKLQITSLQSKLSTSQSSLSIAQSSVSTLQRTLAALQNNTNCKITNGNFVTKGIVGVRLVGGDGWSYGAVELMSGNAIGWLCHDVFNRNNKGAAVVCKMLGFRSGQYEDGDKFATGNGYLLDDVTCTGHESSLAECPNRSERYPSGRVIPYTVTLNTCGADHGGELAGVRCTF